MSATADPAFGPSDLGDQLAQLQAKLIALRKTQKAVVQEANRRRRRAAGHPEDVPSPRKKGGVDLSLQAVNGWFPKQKSSKDPSVPQDFYDLWDVVVVMLEWTGQLTDRRYESRLCRHWKTLYTDSQQVAPEVLAYLEAARRAAEQHPYPGLPSPLGPPPLTEVYVRQRSSPAARDKHNASGGNGPAAAGHGGSLAMADPAEMVFQAADRVCLLIAGPGGGKSTLLRMRLRDTAGAWLAAKGKAGKATPAAVPVWVSARALAEEETQVPDALAAATRKLSQYGRHPALAEARFVRRPCTGAHWQLLVDGLDELSSAGERRAVLEKLANAVTQDPSLYRCVVATRPLTGNELGVLDRILDRPAPRYDLQPFTTDDLHTYTERFFGGRWPQDEAARRARQLTGALHGTSLAELARTPLMAFMLCQSYLAQPERLLPGGRTAVYEAFTDLLYENNQHKRVADSHEQAIKRLVESLQSPRARTETDVAARQVHERLPELIDHLAYQWLTGQHIPLTQALASHEAVHRPSKVQQERWDTFLDDLLQHTGLLAHYTDGLGFTHQTFLEYHAARHATRDEHTRAEILDKLFRHGPPLAQQSYVGFLLDGLLAPSDAIATETAKRIDAFTRRDRTRDNERHRGYACHFLSEQVYLGTNLPVASTAEQLNHLASDRTLDPLDRIPVARALARMDGYRRDGANWLIALANDPTLTHAVHVLAAKELAEVEGYRERTAQVLTQLVARITDHSPLGDQSTHDAHEQFLQGVSRRSAAQLLAQLADDPTLNGTVRLEAARELGQVEGYRERAAQVLIQLADDPTLNGSDRVRSARELAGIPATPTAGELRLLASITNISHPSDRIRAARALTRMDGYRTEGANLLIRFARDVMLTHAVHVLAAKELAEVEGYRERAAQLLTQIADGHVRSARGLAAMEASSQSAEKNEMYRDLSRVEEYPKRAAPILAQLADDPTLNSAVRQEAAQELAVIRRRRGAEPDAGGVC
jgi:hypothetical protein